MSAVISLVQNQSWMATFHKVLWPGLHHFRFLSCCHLPPLGSSWGLVGNNLECYDQGSKVGMWGFPLERSFPFVRRIPAEESSFCLFWLCILSLWMSKKLDLPHGGCAQVRSEAPCRKDPSSDAACTLLLQIRNTVQTLTLFCSAEKAGFSLENVIKMGFGLISTPELGSVAQASSATAL